MTIYRSKRDGLLYVLSICSPWGWIGSWLTYAPYINDSVLGPFQWKKVPGYKMKDFVAISEI